MPHECSPRRMRSVVLVYSVVTQAGSGDSALLIQVSLCPDAVDVGPPAFLPRTAKCPAVLLHLAAHPYLAKAGYFVGPYFLSSFESPMLFFSFLVIQKSWMIV